MPELPEFYDYSQWETDGETSKWYNRFRHWLELGPSRTMIGALRHDDNERGIMRIRRSVPVEWYKQAENFFWRERAATYDRQKNQQREKVSDMTDAVLQQAERIINKPEAGVDEVVDTYLNLLYCLSSSQVKHRQPQRTGR